MGEAGLEGEEEGVITTMMMTWGPMTTLEEAMVARGDLVWVFATSGETIQS